MPAASLLHARRLVLVTRPQPGAATTGRLVAGRLMAGRALVPVISPLLEVTAFAARLPVSTAFQAVAATSGHAVAGLPAGLHGLPFFAVGDATAARARAAGFAQVHSAGADARALAGLVGARCPAGTRLLLASGEGHGMALAVALRCKGLLVVRRVVYAARPVAVLPAAAARALAGNDLRTAMFFSPATARVFVCLLQAARRDDDVTRVEALAISSITAAALAPLPWLRVRVASHPSQDEMLAMLP